MASACTAAVLAPSYIRIASNHCTPTSSLSPLTSSHFSPVPFHKLCPTASYVSQSSFVSSISSHPRQRARARQNLATCSALPPLSETASIPTLTDDGSLAAFPAASGVYAVYDKEGVLQYMGLGRRLAASIQVHADDLPELCAAVKVAVIDAPDRAALNEAWKSWMEEHVAANGSVPPGNESSNKMWTTRKVKRVKPEIKLTPGKHVALNVPIVVLVEKVVKECKVVAFIKGTRTAPECGFSHRVLTLLNEGRVDYETLNVLDEDHNPGLRDAIKEYSQWPTIPQLYVNGEFIGGADILNEMEESGELKKVFASVK